MADGSRKDFSGRKANSRKAFLNTSLCSGAKSPLRASCRLTVESALSNDRLCLPTGAPLANQSYRRSIGLLGTKH